MLRYGKAVNERDEVIARLAAALEQSMDRLGTIAGEAIAATADSNLLMLLGKERLKREAAEAERDAAHQAATAEAALHDLTRVERDAARSALTTVLRGMRSSWWANDHPNWIRAMEDALAATKEDR